ncbi:MAG TPA: HAMP domain-containing sensor histidine kinase, partial [Trebonia sp.]
WWRTNPGRWLAGRTLRTQLIAGQLALLALACASVGIVSYVVLRHTMINQIDAQLQAAGGQYAGCLEENHQEGPIPPGRPAYLNCNKIPGLSKGTFGARAKDGVVTDQGVVGGSSHLSAADRAMLTRMTPDDGFHTEKLTALQGHYRLTAVRGMDNDVLITGLPLSDMEDTLEKVESAEIIAFSAALVLAGVLGTGLVRLALRPLRRVAATAQRVTQLPLASGDVTLPERVPDTYPRTEVGQVGSAFNRMLGHIESALAQRAASEARLRRFAADASHELRTPLAAIRGYAELAVRHPVTDPAGIEQALRRVEAESARMSVLVDELLLLARLDAGRPLAKEPVDISRLAISAASDARAAAADHRWRLELPSEPVMVLGDEDRLYQVVTNLVSNAAKHTPAGTTVTIALAAGGEPGTVELSVTDNGPGIPPELLATLFERFVRGDASRSHEAGSTGLGLSIADAITTAHGGRIRVESVPGKTRFTVTLPRLDGGAAQAGEALRGDVRAVAAGGGERCSADHPGLVGCQEDDERGDVLRLEPWDSQGCLRLQRPDGGLLIPGRIAAGLLPALADGLRVAVLVPGQRGVDQSGDDGVDRDVMCAKLQRRRFHQADDAPLGSRVRRPELGAVLALRGGGDDDPPAAPPHQQRREHAQHVGGAVQVHLDLVVPVRVGHLKQRLERLDAGVGEDDIDAAPFLLHRRRGDPDVLDVPLIGDVLQPPAA